MTTPPAQSGAVSAAPATSVSGTSETALPYSGEPLSTFSLDDDTPLEGGVCDMSPGCEGCQ